MYVIRFLILIIASLTPTLTMSQNWNLEQKIFPDKDGPNGIGYKIDSDGDYAISTNVADQQQFGYAFLFHYNGTTWEKTYTVSSPVFEYGNEFGKSVAIDGNIVAIGAKDKVHLYSIVNDSLYFRQTILASDLTQDSGFGFSIDLSNDKLIVGAPKTGYSGAAYIYRLESSTWTEEAKLNPSAASSNAEFGIDVKIENNTAVVGAHRDQFFTGSIFIYEFSNLTWRERNKILNPENTEDAFGRSVSIHNSKIAVGAPWFRTGDAAVYLLQKTSETWSIMQSIILPGESYMGEFVGLKDNMLVIGSYPGRYVKVFELDGQNILYRETINTPNPLPYNSNRFGHSIAFHDQFLITADLTSGKKGQLHFFKKAGENNWALSQSYEPFETREYDQFTYFEADGDFLAIVNSRDGDGSSNTPSLYMYKKNGSKYERTQKIVSPFPEGHVVSFGGLSLKGNQMLLRNRQGNVGGIIYFEYNGFEWVNKQIISPPSSDIQIVDSFGSTIEISGNWAIVTTATSMWPATVYFYKFDGNSWNLSQEISSASLDLSLLERFGWSISISGNYAAIGSPGENINGSRTGAVYIYKFNGTLWEQNQKLLPTNFVEYGAFGLNVSMSGDRLAVASPSSTNPNLLTNGSVYIYKLNPSTSWQIEKKIQTNLDFPDAFGYVLKLKSNRLIAGSGSKGYFNVYDLNENDWLLSGKFLAGTESYTGFISIEENRILTSANKPTTDYLGGAVHIYQRPLNVSPILSGTVTNQFINSNESFTFSLPNDLFVDGDGDLLTYSSTLSNDEDLPNWLTFDSSQKKFSGITPKGDHIFEIKVQVSDGNQMNDLFIFQ